MPRLLIPAVLILLLTACTGTAAEPTPTLFVLPTTQLTQIADELIEVSPTTDSPTAVENVVIPTTQELTIEPTAALPTLIPGRPAAPADPNGDYRYDPASVVAATGQPQLIEFFTDWCPNCRSLKPTIHALEAEYWSRLDFVYLDREDPANREIVDRYGIVYQPVLILINPDGTEVQRWFGVPPESDLRTAFDAFLGG